MRDAKKDEYVFLGLLLIPTIWFALLIAPYMDKGLINAIPYLNEALNHPFQIQWTNSTLKTIGIFLIIYVLGVGMYLSSSKNYRRTEEYGSAKWANPNTVCKKYANKDYFSNKVFSQNVRMGLDGKKHRRNLNTVVIGGSGAGKTRFYAKPNIMQCNTSFVVLDPKGEIIRSVGHLLEDNGYVIKVIDLIDMSKSLGYNPFHYIQSDKDVLKLITNLIRNTTPKGSSPNDPFWEKSETALLEALMLYLYHYAPEDEQNFTMVMEMLNYAEVKEDEEDYESPLDELFKRLEMIDSNSLALKQYKIYKQAAGKTAKSILISVGVRLAAFNLEELASLTKYDEMELEQIGERKTALFAIIPDNDSTFNFVVGMLYTQLFQMLYYQADYVHGGELPVPVHFLMDEFANVALPDEFDKLLSTMRSRQIFVSIILQNLAQIKALYKDSWESILGNCDETYYLGGNEQSTHKYISELLGKETLDTNTYGKSEGRSGNYSTNYQQTGRELLTADEVRLLNNNYGLLFIKGERPVKDKKYDLLKHPNIKQTLDGLQTALPIGDNKLNITRTLLTESAAVFIPFRAHEIMQKGGIWYGQNAITNNPILCNKALLQNPNSFVLGIPGSGKSFLTKEEIEFLILSTNDDIIIADPEGEYDPIIKAMKGQIIRIGTNSKDYINAMDMSEGYGDSGNAIADKSQFIMSLFEQLDTNHGGISPIDRSIIDRCISLVYQDAMKNNYIPTLKHLYNKLLEQSEPEAKSLAIKLELFTNGSLNIFAHETNVDIKSRILSFNIFNLGKQLKTMGLLVITDAIINRVNENWRKGKRTHVFIDEIHVIFENEESATFFASAWRQFRKRDAYPTGITQNVKYLLSSQQGTSMLSNSEFIVMLNQSANDREDLARLLNISEEQMGYITNAPTGSGLIKYGGSIVPFVNKMPKGLLYDLNTTKPGDRKVLQN